MAHDIQTVTGAIAGGIILVALVLQESPEALAVVRLLLPVGCGQIFFPVCCGSQESVFLFTKPSGKSAYFLCPAAQR